MRRCGEGRGGDANWAERRDKALRGRRAERLTQITQCESWRRRRRTGRSVTRFLERCRLRHSSGTLFKDDRWVQRYAGYTYQCRQSASFVDLSRYCVTARQLCAPVRQLCAPVRRCAVRSRPAVCGWLADLSSHSVWRPGSSVRLLGSSVRLFAAVRFGPGLLCAAVWPTCHVTLRGGQAALCACQAALCACSPLCGSVPACCVRLFGRLVTSLCVAARQLCAPVRQLCAPVRRCAVRSRPAVCGCLADLSRHSVWRPGSSVRLSGSSVRLFAAVRFGPGLLCAAGWPTCHVTLCGGQAALCACDAVLVLACCVRLVERLVMFARCVNECFFM